MNTDVFTVVCKMDTDPRQLQQARIVTGPRLGYLSPQLSTTTWHTMSLDQDSNSEVFQQIQELNKDVDSTFQFVCGVNEILCTTTAANIFLVLIAVFTIGETFVGFHYLEDCPLEHRIPIFLFVDGCFGLLKSVHLLAVNYKQRKHSTYNSDAATDFGREQRANYIVEAALDVFLVVWQIVGTVWTLSIYFPMCQAPLYEPNNRCDCNLYVFALVEVGLFAFLIVVSLILNCGLVMFYRYTNLFES